MRRSSVQAAKQKLKTSTSCPLYPRKRALSDMTDMSALRQKRLNAVQQKNLLNHLDGAGERRRRLVERDFAERKTSNCNRTR
jgi:hypothetical protein